MNPAPGLWNVIKREASLLSSRPMWLVGILLVPVCMALFFVSILGEGLPKQVPVAIVDMDHTDMSRRITRSLNTMELVNITQKADNFHQAMDAVQRGEVFGFFVIPSQFEQDAIAGNGPTLTFYSNLTFYVPGTLAFKGFKTLGVTTAGQVVHTDLVSKGAPSQMASNIIQPMTVNIHPLNNPWLNYSYYLSTSFLPGILELMIFIMTAYAICHELKRGSSPQWLATARGNIWTAVIGKLAPQTLMFTVIGFGMNALMFGYHHFPMNGSMANLLLAMFLFVVACQSFATFVCCVVPNLRLSLSVCCLSGILAFSLAAFSYPVEAMYGGCAIFSYILPVRWYFLIYIDQALNGIPLYYSRLYYVALLVFPILATVALPRLRRSARKPVYVP